MTPTLVVAPGEFDEERIEVTGEAYRHLFRARRLVLGEPVRLVDGQGRARCGHVALVERHRAVVATGDPAPHREPEQHVELAVAVLRPERASWMVEKATEVGVGRIVWFTSERTPRDYGPTTLTRLERVARAAVEQCGRSLVPEIVGPLSFFELEERIRTFGASLFFDVPVFDVPVFDVHAFDVQGEGALAPTESLAPPRWLRLLVGPEGGWSEEERRRLLALGARPRSLGERILRVETAAVVAAALVLCQPGNESTREN